MIEVQEIFKNFKLNTAKLKAMGFKKQGDAICNEYAICDGQMLLEVAFSGDMPSVKVIDVDSGEEYYLAFTFAEGAFVGALSNQVNEILKDIACRANSQVRYSGQLKAVVDYARARYHTHPEYLWKSSPDCFILRRKNSKKWYAAIMDVDGKKIDKSSGVVTIINLRVKPTELAKLIDNKNYFPGFHMNKKSWYTVILDRAVPDEVLFALMDNSFNLADK